jgi:hypothetical protein
MIRTAFLLALLDAPLAHAAPNLVTVSERSGFQATYARLEFFARRHPSWDERLNLSPVLHTDVAL